MKYISYQNDITESQRKLNNKEFINKKLIEYEEYFDNMFKNIDKNIKLDVDQRKIILNDEKYLMVIAGAGSGKTTTINAKINYLIDKKKVKDDEIIVISFTNKAVKELDERINKDFQHNVKVTTFHKLGYEIIKENSMTPPKIIKENNIIKKYIESQIIRDKKTLKNFLDYYLYYFDISEEILLLNHDKYIRYKNNQKYPTIKSKIEYINSELVNTPIEKTIADFLYMNNLTYKYKEKYPYLEDYFPDFTIYYEDKIFYLEHINIENIKKFKMKINIIKLRKIHKKYKTNLIEIYNDNIIETLEKELKKN